MREKSRQTIILQNDKQQNDPEYIKRKRAQGRKQMKNNWKDPKFVEMRSMVASEQFGTPEARRASSERLKNRRKDPVFCENVSNAAGKMCKKRWQDPEFREMMTETARVTMTENNKSWWSDQKHRDAHSERQSKYIRFCIPNHRRC